MRQCLEAAASRRGREQRARLRVAEWQVKTVCTWIGAQAAVDVKQHGGRNPLVDLASDIDIFGRGSAEQRELDRIRGPRVADRLEDDPRFGRTAADPEQGVEADNGAGSYEAFLALMGGPPPVPGREAPA